MTRDAVGGAGDVEILTVTTAVTQRTPREIDTARDPSGMCSKGERGSLPKGREPLWETLPFTSTTT